VEYIIISDIPTPWREPVFERVYQKLNGRVEVVYYKSNEKRRLWTFKMGSHPKTILKGLTLTIADTERFLNLGIVAFLLRRRPRVAIITASLKDPTTWLAMIVCRMVGTRIGLLADTWLGRDRGITTLQVWARKAAYNWFGDTFVGASRETLNMYKHYNTRITNEECFLSHLVADNDYFDKRCGHIECERPFDVMFAGRIVKLKNPAFFANVCLAIKAEIGRCNVLIIGDGEDGLKTEMQGFFERHGISFKFAGFIPHAALPDYYSEGRLLLFPTTGDCWGVVINEAMLAGAPVITSEWTAAAGELVLNGQNGYVLPLDVEAWASAATELLTNNSKWESFSQCARHTVRDFNYDRAADGILDTIEYLSSESERTCGYRADSSMGLKNPRKN
jgi:glycosyltransferase involved in cell wall biosynthesis